MQAPDWDSWEPGGPAVSFVYIKSIGILGNMEGPVHEFALLFFEAFGDLDCVQVLFHSKNSLESKLAMQIPCGQSHRHVPNAVFNAVARTFTFETQNQHSQTLDASKIQLNTDTLQCTCEVQVWKNILYYSSIIVNSPNF